MPLHDWSKLPEWDGVHLLWITELFRVLKGKLPPGYRAGLAEVPTITIGVPSIQPDIVLGHGETPATFNDATSADNVSDLETEVTVLSLNPSKELRVFRGCDLVAVVELISPGNKDRKTTQQTTTDRIVGYLAMGVHVLFVDVHAQPLNYSLANAIAQSLDYYQLVCPAPQAMSYRVGIAPDGISRSLTIRRVPLGIGQALPAMNLSLSQSQRVQLDLEKTYSKATSDYLSWLPSLNGSAT